MTKPQYIKKYAKKHFHVPEQQLNFVHMALTSNDLNSPAYMKTFINGLNEVFNEFNIFAIKYVKFITRTKDIVMMSRTHGQPAVPTYLAKELYVHFDIVLKNYNELFHFINNKNNIECNFGGAVNNFNAHILIDQDYDWVTFADKFIDSFGMKRSYYATQIDHYETVSKVLSMINSLCDRLLTIRELIWDYYTCGYLMVPIDETITSDGSSAMPQKVNLCGIEKALTYLTKCQEMCSIIKNILCNKSQKFQRIISDSSASRMTGELFADLCISLFYDVRYYNISSK